MMSAVLYLIVFVALLNLMMFMMQPGMIFIPYNQLDATPQAWGLSYEDINISTSDGEKLHGWYIPSEDAERTLLFFHGNAGNISHRGDSLKIFHQLGLNILIIDYRGYGASTGKPSEKGLYRDADAAWEYLTNKRKIKPENIVVFGRSLGAAVGLRLASRVQVSVLILESTFSSGGDFARRVYPLLSHLAYLRYEFDNVKHIKQVKSPVLILHSPDDEIIPYDLGEKVYLAANQPKEFIKLQGDHNTGFLESQPGYQQSLADFLAKY